MAKQDKKAGQEIKLTPESAEAKRVEKTRRRVGEPTLVEGRRKRIPMKVAIGLAILAILALLLVPAAFAETEHCPAGGQKFDTGSGTQVVNGVTISWSENTVTVSGGTVTFCVKASTGQSGYKTLTNDSWTIDWTNNGGQIPAISYLVVYSTGTNTPAASSTVASSPTNTRTPAATSTSRPPTGTSRAPTSTPLTPASPTTTRTQVPPTATDTPVQITRVIPSASPITPTPSNTPNQSPSQVPTITASPVITDITVTATQRQPTATNTTRPTVGPTNPVPTRTPVGQPTIIPTKTAVPSQSATPALTATPRVTATVQGSCPQCCSCCCEVQIHLVYTVTNQVQATQLMATLDKLLEKRPEYEKSIEIYLLPGTDSVNVSWTIEFMDWVTKMHPELLDCIK